MLLNLTVLFGTLVAMEGVGTLAHKYIMHGWGWACSKPMTSTCWRWRWR